MRDLPMVASLRTLVAVAILGTWLGSLNFSQFMGRLVEQPDSYRDLAVFQLQMGLLPFAMATILAAWSMSRLVGGSGQTLWLTGAVPAATRSRAVLLAGSVPAIASWLTFWLVSSLFFGSGSGIVAAISLMCLGIPSSVAGAAFGQLVGQVRPAWMAAPLAAILGYLVPAVLTAILDDHPYQVLGPGLGGDPPPRLVTIWALGGVLWFSGVAALLQSASIYISSRPKEFNPRWILAAMTTAAIGVLAVHTVS